MGDAGRFAIGIAVLVGAMIFFFFAFHPGGVEGINNPAEMFLWLFTEFNSASSSGSGSTSQEQSSQATSQGVGGSTPAAPTSTGA